MKRSQEFTPASPSQAPPLQKKMRITPPASFAAEAGQADQNGMAGGSEDGGWTKVEKRKARKHHKAEAKLDVCVFLRVCSLCRLLRHLLR